VYTGQAYHPNLQDTVVEALNVKYRTFCLGARGSKTFLLIFTTYGGNNCADPQRTKFGCNRLQGSMLHLALWV